MSTPSVHYAYADGSGNTVRQTSITYPNGRTITFDYGDPGGVNDAASRVETIVDDDATVLARYEYRGLDRFGRVKDSHWYDYGALSDAARIHSCRMLGRFATYCANVACISSPVGKKKVPVAASSAATGARVRFVSSDPRTSVRRRSRTHRPRGTPGAPPWDRAAPPPAAGENS